MKSKLLFVFSLFVIGSFSAQNSTDWGVLTYDFSLGSYGAVFALSENAVFVAKSGHVYSSVDGGQNWVDYTTTVQENFYDIDFEDLNTGYIVGDNGTLIKTNNGGVSWSSITLNTSLDLYSIAITPNGNVWIVGENGITISSSDNGATWQENTSLTTEVLNAVAFRNNTEGFIAGNNGLLLHTQDAGQTWQTISINSTEDLYSLEVDNSSIYFISGESGFFSQNSEFHVSRSGYLIYHSNDLVNWDTTDFTNNFGLPVSEIEVYNSQVYAFASSFGLCDCCSFMIGAYDFSTSSTISSYSDDLTGSDCDHINMNYSDFHIFNENAAYVLVGDRVLKMGETGGFNYFSTENFQNPVINFYPNPVSEGELYVSSEHVNTRDLAFDLYNINGKLIKSFSNITENEPISIENVPKGVYFLKVKNHGSVSSTKKILVD
tara:strand:- start:595 stop:1893 length:1299 start_codon:yes stop_codon:yes gene_type:complete